MLNQILAMTWKEIKVMLTDRSALVVLFLLPIAFILVMTVALQGSFSSGSKDHPITLLVANEDRGGLAEKVIADLRQVDGLTLVEQVDGQSLTRASIDAKILVEKSSVGLVFPADFSERITGAGAGSVTTVSFITDPTLGSQVLSPVRGMVQGYVDREVSIARAETQIEDNVTEITAQMPAEIAGTVREYAAQIFDGEEISTQSQSIVYQVVSPAAYKVEKTPTSAEQNVPGYTIYGVFFIMQTIATSFFREKNEGTLRRLQAAPVSRVAILAGKTLPYYLVNLFQIALMFLIGVLVFKMDLGHSPAAMVLISLATAAAATGLGMLLTSLGKSYEQVSSLGTLLSVVMAVIGGMMVPSFAMPDFMQKASLITPHAWALTAYQDVIVRGLGVSAVLPAVGVLLVFSAAFWGIALWRFRFD